MTTDTAARIIPPAGCPDACWLAAVILEHRALSPPDATGITRLADGTELLRAGELLEAEEVVARLERRIDLGRADADQGLVEAAEREIATVTVEEAPSANVPTLLVSNTGTLPVLITDSHFLIVYASVLGILK